MTSGSHGHVFPPALVPVLRERCAAKAGCLAHVADDLLVHLLTTVFFAGLETYEGEHNPVGVALLGRSAVDLVLPEGAESGGAPLYQWKIHRFDSPRPFNIPELLKLALAGADRRIYSAVRVVDESRLVIAGLAREGFNVGRDPFVKIVASRPGCLSIRNGRDLLLEYERGAVLTGGEDVVFSAGPVRRALGAIARAAGLDDEGVADYLDAVRSLVREMAAHGWGGIMIIDPDEQPTAADSATYKMVRDSSLSTLIRLAQRIGRKREPTPSSRPSWGDVGPRRPPSDPPLGGEGPAFGQLLRNAFLTEAERVIEEMGALTGIDGATLLNRDLALVAFGVILPVASNIAVEEAMDTEGVLSLPVDLGSRGTRHRAAAKYADEHPGSVVFVASEDGQVACMFRESGDKPVLFWRLGPSAHG